MWSSYYTTGGVLLQEGKRIAFTSCTLTSTEQNYAIVEIECLPIFHTTEKIHHYIKGIDNHAETNCKPLAIIFH